LNFDNFSLELNNNILFEYEKDQGICVLMIGESQDGMSIIGDTVLKY